jgi:2-hydroxychromene-2-carboxylate isomerase
MAGSSTAEPEPEPGRAARPQPEPGRAARAQPEPGRAARPVPGAGGHNPPQFFYDLASPDSYLAAERVVDVLGEVPEFVPVRMGGATGFRCAAEEDIYRAGIEQRAAAHGLLPVVWPPDLDADTDWAMLVATYAKQAGRVVAFSLAAFRQAFAAGRDLADRETVLIAAAAAEMHPTAVVKGAELRGTRARLEAANAAARAAGVLSVPAVMVDGRRLELEGALG